MERGAFDYEVAFSRNIGWITEWEQQQLRGKRIAIAGMGGVGGAHLLALVRLGIGGFNIADLDRFEVANFNRQVGATMATVGREKADVMTAMARDINPELDVRAFPQGIDEDTIDAFLDGVDLYVDGLDFFVMGIRRQVFARCAALGIPAVTAAPVGFGAAYIVFMPGKMTFEELFRMEGLPEDRQYVNFAAGLTPAGFHRAYMADPGRLDLAGKRGPSTAAAINICAGVAAAEAAKILLGRGKVYAAPWVHQFDAFRSRWRRSYLPFGNAGPLQALKRAIGYRVFGRLSRNARPAEQPCDGDDIDRILDYACWSPSGDNSQPWRFERAGGADTVIAHITTRSPRENIYEYNDGQPTLLSAGCLVETARIAGTGFGRRLTWRYLGGENGHHRIELTMPVDASVTPDPLLPYLRIRSVNRWPYQRQPLTAGDKAALEAALGEELGISWRVSDGARKRMARLNAMATDIRLRLHAAHLVHEKILDWDRAYSRTGVPVAAVGLDAMTVRLMRGVMKSWRRVDFMNRVLAGTVMPRLQLDLAPGVRCSAHFLISGSPAGADGRYGPRELIEAGRSVQRFWLTATRLGLSLQPGLAPLCFATYARAGDHDLLEGHVARAQRLNDALTAIADGRPGDVLFAGRIGRAAGGRHLASRSIRLTLGDLTAPSGG